MLAQSLRERLSCVEQALEQIRARRDGSIGQRATRPGIFGR